MKVGVYLDSYTPEDGGAHTFQAGLVDALARLKAQSQHEFLLFVADKAKRGDLAGLPLVQLRKPNPYQKAVALIARNWPNFRSAIRWRDTAERQMRKAGAEFVWFLSARPKELDLPYLAIVWDLQHRLQPWFPEVGQWGQWEIRERGYQRFLGRASAIIAGTQAGKAEITRFYGLPDERVRVLPHPTPEFVLQASETSGDGVAAKFGLQKPFLFYPAQFWAHKNHIGLLKALRQLKDAGQEIDLAFVGADFGNRAYIQAKVQEWGLQERVHFLGFVEREDLIGLYREAFALVYYSAFGPENLPPLEAMALGCPVIAGAVAGAEEQFGDAALLADPYQPGELAKAITSLLGDEKLRNTLIQRGKQRAAKWTSEDFVRGVFDFLDEFQTIRDLWG